jgi:hypothetical protein
MGVFVSVGGMLVLVAVGGTGVDVLVGGRVGTLVGGGAGVLVSASRGRRVAVGGISVRVGATVLVSDGRGVKEAVRVGTSVSVGTKTVTTCSVRAAAVSRLATARSRIFNGTRVTET